MAQFEITIQEKAIYWQEGTVIVEAPDEETAKKLAEEGKYEHMGDNEIFYDTEQVLEREAQMVLNLDEPTNIDDIV